MRSYKHGVSYSCLKMVIKIEFHECSFLNAMYYFSGRYVGSGQISQSGSRACVILWDWASRKEINRYHLHKAN